MAVYDINGNALTTIYDSSGNSLSLAYDTDGNIIFNGSDGDLPSDMDDYRVGRVLVWEENFDGDNGTEPDTNTWGHEVGRIRNYAERQYYTDGNRNSYLDGESHLIIKAVRESMEGSSWSSASIHTNNKYEFTYGRVEAKMKLPNLTGAFPAFWMLGACLEVVPLGYYDTTTDRHIVEKGIRTPLSPEVDIMEQFGTSDIQSAVHYGTEEDGRYTSAMYTLAVDDTTQWHVYSVEWTADYLKWYVDDVQVGLSAAPKTVPRLNQPMYILLNLAIGNKAGSPEVNEMEMAVDWVRAYLPEGVIEKYSVKSIDLSVSELTLVVGETSILDFIFTPSLCWNKTIVWTSNNTSVAEVYGGKVYAIGTGTATITATAHNGVTATCSVTVA